MCKHNRFRSRFLILIHLIIGEILKLELLKKRDLVLIIPTSEGVLKPSKNLPIGSYDMSHIRVGYFGWFWPVIDT